MSICSATRRALAMIVNVGLTADEEQKKDESQALMRHGVGVGVRNAEAAVGLDGHADGAILER